MYTFLQIFVLDPPLSAIHTKRVRRNATETNIVLVMSSGILYIDNNNIRNSEFYDTVSKRR